MKEQFVCRIEHNANTIKTLFKTKYYVYEKKRMLIRMIIGVVLIGVAFAADLSIAAQGVLLMIGAWLVVSRDFPSVNRADTTIQARNGKFPIMTYSFRDDGVELKDGSRMFLKHSQFERLIEDERYLYLFLSKESVCMIDKLTVTPEPVEDFMTYMKENTGREWEQIKSIFNINLYDLLYMLRRHRKG